MTDKLTAAELAHLAAVTAAATPGPWVADGFHISAHIPGRRPNGEVIGDFMPSISSLITQEQQCANSDHCAAFSPKMAARLLAHVAALEAEIAALKPKPPKMSEPVIYQSEGPGPQIYFKE